MVLYILLILKILKNAKTLGFLWGHFRESSYAGVNFFVIFWPILIYHWENI